MNQTYFTNFSMKNVAPSLLKLIGVDRQSTNVSMFYKDLSNLAGFRIVEKAVGINTFRTIFQPCMTEYIAWVIVLMVPYERDFDSIVMFERVSANHSSIRAFKVVSGCPSAEIAGFGLKCSFHFEFPPCFVFFLF